MSAGTEVATTQPTTAPTRMVSVLPYAYWPMGERWGYARTLAFAGDMIPVGLRAGNDVEATAARVFLVLETGAMLGLHPMASLQGIDVIKGNATISPMTFTAIARGRGMDLDIREIGTIEGGDFAIEVTLDRKDGSRPTDARFSLKDALRAGLISKYEPKVAGGDYVVTSGSDNWQKYPQDMTQWRALGRLNRRGGADITMGIGYFPEELEALVNEEGVRRDMTEEEDALIIRFKGEKDASGTFMGALDDKADMEKLWQEQHPYGADEKRHATEVWTERVQAEFAAHLSKLTKDSRPPKEGTPGHTGDPAVDGAVAVSATGEVDGDSAQDEEAPAGPPPVDEEAPPVDEHEPRREVTIADMDAAERAERQRVEPERAPDGMIPPGAALDAARAAEANKPGFNAGALEGLGNQ